MATSCRICISSPPDREKLVAEILFGDVQWAEIDQEADILQAVLSSPRWTALAYEFCRCDYGIE
jgi:hypothetical protein